MPLYGLTTSFLLRSTMLGGPLAAVAGGGVLLDDYPSASVAFSFRKLRTAYAGSAVRIRRSSDDAEADIGFDGNGDFDTAAAATHISGGTGYIVTWYDQSGNGLDVTQATTVSQPIYTATGLNSLPAMTKGSTNFQLSRSSVANTSLFTANTTMMFVLTHPTAGTTRRIVTWGAGAGDDLYFWSPYLDNNFYLDIGGSGSGRVSVAAGGGYNTGAHLLEGGRTSGDDQYITLDGSDLVSASRSVDLPAASKTLAIGLTSDDGWTGAVVSEAVMWGADLAGDRAGARSNIKTYWGTP